MTIAVYTANFGGYDKLIEPSIDTSGIDWLYFTDNDYESQKWQIQKVKRPCDSAKHASRHYLDQSHLLDYDITIMHGANARLLIEPQVLIDSYLYPDYDIALFKHPHRTKVFDEFAAVVMWHKDSAENTRAQLARYKQEGFTDNIGLSACGFMIRRRTDAVRQLEEIWWYEVKNGSYRDQLSFDYARWKMKDSIKVNWIPGDIFNSPILKIGRHG